MEQLTQERCKIIKNFYQKHCSVKETWHGLRARYRPHHRPIEQTIHNVKKCEREFKLVWVI